MKNKNWYRILDYKELKSALKANGLRKKHIKKMFNTIELLSDIGAINAAVSRGILSLKDAKYAAKLKEYPIVSCEQSPADVTDINGYNEDELRIAATFISSEVAFKKVKEADKEMNLGCIALCLTLVEGIAYSGLRYQISDPKAITAIEIGFISTVALTTIYGMTQIARAFYKVLKPSNPYAKGSIKG